MQPIFITGIGTDVGKTVASAVVTQALQAHYWKPIQAGFADGTDAETVQGLTNLPNGNFHKEVYKLKEPLSPHEAAKREGVQINLSEIVQALPQTASPLVIEGAGGLLVPLNDTSFVVDLIKALNAKVILVSRHYLGSINHSLLTAHVCKQYNIPVLGWLFNDDRFTNYEDEICKWTGIPSLGTIPFTEKLSKDFVQETASKLSSTLRAKCLPHD